METPDLTTTILQNIRDDIAKLDAKLNAKLDSEIAAVRRELQNCVTRNEFCTTMSLLDERIDRMDARLIENDLRATTAHQELQATLNQMMTYFGAQTSLEARVDRCERDIVDLKERVF
jgi:chromosome segregation ATPase